MQQPPYLSTLIYEIRAKTQDEVKNWVGRLLAVSGVADVVMIPEEGLVTLKVDKQIIDKTELLNLIREGNLRH